MVTDDLRAAALWYRDAWKGRVDRGAGGAGGSVICNDLTSPFEDFMGPERQSFCTNIAAEVASIVAEALVRVGERPTIEPVSEAGAGSTE